MTSTSYDELARKTLLWIIGINIGVFLLQMVLLVAGVSTFTSLFALSVPALLKGYVWTPLTYAFLHSTSTSFPTHLLFNMLMLWVIGRVVCMSLDQKRFIQLYLASIIGGGILFILASLIGGGGHVIGASAGVSGLLVFFALLAPEEEILFFFVIRMKRKVMLYIVVGLSLFGFVFGELLGSGASLRGTAHSAHLGGMLGAWLFFRFVYVKSPYSNKGAIRFAMPSIFKRKPKESKSGSFRYSVNISQKNPKDMKREVDRILDKINSEGFGALNSEEKRTLDEARDLLRKR